MDKIIDKATDIACKRGPIMHAHISHKMLLIL